jgi:hypothetical protein
MRSKRGQALIETAVFFLVLSVLLGGFAGFTKWFVVRQKLLLAAKLGALLYSSGHWKKPEVEARMKQFLITGTPALTPAGVRVSVGPHAGLESWIFELDESVASYTPPRGWHSLLSADLTLTEKFVVKHAPKYWAPFQQWAGPAVAYGR